MSRLSLLLLLLLPAVVFAAAPPPLRRDLHGDPLPRGVVARLGTVRFRWTFPPGHLVTSLRGTVLAPLIVTRQAPPLRLPSGTPLHLEGNDLSDEVVAFSPDDRLIALSRRNGLALWDL